MLAQIRQLELECVSKNFKPVLGSMRQDFGFNPKS
jgi:hypothetical protein